MTTKLNQSWRRIFAVLLQEVYLLRNSLEILFDVYIFPLVTISAFGILSRALAQSFAGPQIHYLLLGLLLWEVVRVGQYTMIISSLWNVWSRNLGNMLISPLSIKEYLIAHVISSCIKVALALVMLLTLSGFIFDLNLLSLGLFNLLWCVVALLFFAISFGMMMLGIILYFGQRMQAVAWGTVFIIQLPSANVYPISILPTPLRIVTYAFPGSYVFEAARTNLVDHSLQLANMLWAFGLDALYCVVAVYFFIWIVGKSKKAGRFAQIVNGEL